MTMDRMSELEGCVLGLIWRDGPCTPYRIRRVFQVSPNPQWSGSAGAIYPLMERLEARGWIRSQSHTTGERHGRKYRISKQGLKILREWLAPPLSVRTAAVPSDPLRLRIEFLTALQPAQRRAFLKDAISQVREQLRVVEEYSEQSRAEGNIPAYAASLGAVGMMQARVQWLRQVQRLLQRMDRAPGTHEKD